MWGWISGLFGFVAKLVKAIKAFLNSEVGVFLQKTGKFIYEKIKEAEIQFSKTSDMTEEQKKAVNKQRAEWIFEQVAKYCRDELGISYEDRWINYGIETLYNLGKVGLLLWL